MISDPKSNLDQFGLVSGESVADLGVGAGFYTIASAERVGENGRVFAIDVQRELAEGVKKLAESKGFQNVISIWGDIEKMGGTKIKDDGVDSAIASNILFQIEDKRGFVSEIKRILKPGGRVLVIDWKDSFAGLGPHPTHVFSLESAKSLFSEAGFSLDREIKAGDHHYGFVALKGK